jgi:hypothetical protein
VASGSTDTFSVPFPYLDKTHVQIKRAGVLLVVTTDYTWVSASSIQLVAGNPAAGTIIERRRVTPVEPLTTFSPGNLDTTDLNVSELQPLYVAQEAADAVTDLSGASFVGTPVTAGLPGVGGLVPIPSEGGVLGWAGGVLVNKTLVELGVGNVNDDAALGGGAPSHVDVPTQYAAKSYSDGLFNAAIGRVLNVRQYGAVGDGVTDDQPAFAAAYAAAKALGAGTSEGACGHVWAPPGYKYKFGASLLLDVPVKLTVDGEILYTPTTGAAVVVGSTLHTARGNTQYDIKLGVVRAVNGNAVAPTGINTAGTRAIEIRDMQFSKVSVEFAIAFTHAGIWANATNNVYVGQHVQDNYITLGEAAYCGVGFLAESVDAALGAFQVNEVHIGNSFVNWKNIVLGKSGDGNTNNNILIVTACDADTGGGNVELWSSYNFLQFGYVNGTITLQASTFYNKVYHQVGKGQCTVTDSGTGNLVQNNVEGTLTQERWETTGILPMHVLKSKDAGAATAVLVDYYRDSATPLANDNGVGLQWSFNNDAAAKFAGSRIRAAAVTVTAGTEHGRLIFTNRLSGADVDVASLWQGLSIGPTAADQGQGTLNVATGYYLAGVAIANSTGIIVPTGKVATPQTNDGAALGTTALQWSDLFLATGAVINWNNGDVLATHSANLLAFTGASTGYTFDAPVSATAFVPTAATVPTNGMYLGAANTVSFAANTTALLNLSTSAFRPVSSGLVTLGSAANPFGDTFIKATGKLDFGSDVTITHATDALSFAGAANGYSFDATLVTTGNMGVGAAQSFLVGANSVVGARNTGWAAMTGTTNKATVYDTATVTLPQLAGRMMALQAALTTHGLIGT